MTYDVQFFIDKFEAIPESNIIQDRFSNGRGGHCANGWCGINSTDQSSEESIAIKRVFEPLVVHYRKDFRPRQGIVPSHLYNPEFPERVAIVNNGDSAEYQQPTPKQRILAALYDIRDMEKKDIGKATEQPKVKIVYVSVPVSITEQAKELIEN